MTAEQVIRVADQHHRAGRPTEAQKICRELLARHPDYPDALHLLGILMAQAGDLDAAIDLIERAVRFKPDFSQAWGNLGCILVNRGKREQAIPAYQRLIELKPTDARAHYALGIILQDCGRLDDAITALSTATQLMPNEAEGHFQLGKAFRGRGRLDAAIAAYSRAVALNPRSAEVHNSLGNALRDSGMLDEAIVQYARAIQLRPDDAVSHLNLGNALLQKDRFEAAIMEYESALRLDGGCSEAYNQMGFALANLDRFEEAMLAHRGALAVRPDDARSHESLGATLLLKHDMAGAEASFRRALSIGPPSAEVWNGLGSALKCLGQFEEASKCFRQALATSKDGEGALFYRGLISTDRQMVNPAEVERLIGIVDQPANSVDDRIATGFVLGQLLDEADRFDEAFPRFATANSLFKQSRAASGEHFDARTLHGLIDRITDRFTPQLFTHKRQWGDCSELPVFIVGMPRSGTTLVEQIAASHPDVFGAGELSDIERLSTDINHGALSAEEQSLNAASIATASKAYLDRLRTLGGGTSRVIDKMPGNVFHLGLIALMFPCARVIFCRRDARDICLSCYFQQFTKNNLLYTYDLADCARQFLETERIISHWKKVLPLRMLEVQYEELVDDQEGQSRRLIDFLGLVWDPACLEFHNTQRTVTTASVWQVRQPMYSRSIGRWRNYEKHLGPLMDVLNGPLRQSGTFSNSPITKG